MVVHVGSRVAHIRLLVAHRTTVMVPHVSTMVAVARAVGVITPRAALGKRALHVPLEVRGLTRSGQQRTPANRDK